MTDIVLQLLENDEFVQCLSMASSIEEMQTIFSQNGVELSPEELEQAMAQRPSGELNENDLEAIAGGGIVSWIDTMWRKLNGRSNPRGGGGFYGGGDGSAGGR